VLFVPLVVLIAVVAVANAAANRAAAAPDAGSVDVGVRAVTPVFSFRRLPDPLVITVRASSLAASLQKVSDNMQSSACLAVAVEGRTVVQQSANTVFLPGSNQKIITAAVALDVLGSDTVFTTSVRGNVVEGVAKRLVLVGGGDPLLSTDPYPKSWLNTYPPTNVTRIEKLADDVTKAGVKRVDVLVGDASRYDRKTEAPGWINAISNRDAAPLSALMINDGYIGNGTARRASSTVGALEVFRRLLEDRGVEVGKIAEGKAGDAPEVAKITSAPLTAVVEEMLTTSDNNTAELLVKEIGRKASKTGSTAAGTKAMKERLALWGIPTDRHVFADGSGLSDLNRVSCNTFVRVLARSGKDSPLYAGMAVAGKSGTLADYLKGTPADGVMRAKTGTLKSARALSGYFPAKNGEMIQFSFIVNGARAKSRAERLWDDLARGLATYPGGAAPSDLGPRPVEAT